MGNDPDAGVVHYLLQVFHWEPARYLAMNQYERAFIRASIQLDREEREARAKEDAGAGS